MPRTTVPKFNTRPGLELTLSYSDGRRLWKKTAAVITITHLYTQTVTPRVVKVIATGDKEDVVVVGGGGGGGGGNGGCGGAWLVA